MYRNSHSGAVEESRGTMDLDDWISSSPFCKSCSNQGFSDCASLLVVPRPSKTISALYHTIYYTILYYTMLYYYYTILYYTILYYTIRYDTIRYDTIRYYTILYCTRQVDIITPIQPSIMSEGHPHMACSFQSCSCGVARVRN